MKSNISKTAKRGPRQFAPLISVFLMALCTCLSNTGHAQQNGYVRAYQFGNASFDGPIGVAIDSKDNVFVADSENQRVVKFSNSGTYLMQLGDASGNGHLFYPNGVAVDGNGNVFVIDSGVLFGIGSIAIFNSSGNYITRFGTFGSNNGQLLDPIDITVDLSGNIYVADINAYDIVKFSNSGNYITQFFNSSFYNVAVDSNGNIFVSDGNTIRKFDSNGNFILQFGNFDSIDAINIDKNGNVFVANSSYFDVPGFVEFSNSGTYITQAIDSELEGTEIYGIAVDSKGSVFVDSYTLNYIIAFVPAPSIISITTNVTDTVISPDSFSATVTLDRPAPADLDVQITTTGSALNPPKTLHFSAGQISAMLTVNTNFIPMSETDLLTATLNNSSKSVNVATRPIRVKKISFPNSVQADMIIPGTVTLEKALPQGQVIYLLVNSTNYYAAHFTVLGGYSTTVVGPSNMANVAIFTGDVLMDTDVTLSAAASAEDPGMSTMTTVKPFEPILTFTPTPAPTRDKTTGDIVVSILISNVGSAPATNYTTTSATLNGVNTSTTLPTTPVTFAPKGSTTVVLHFPGSVGTGGQTVPLVVKADYGNSTAYVINHNTLNANVTLPYVQVSGTVILEGCVNLAQSINFVFRPIGGGTTVQRTQTLSATGAFAFSDIPAGQYNLWVKGAKWLAKVVAVNANSGVSNVTTTLLAGDADNNNLVNIGDFGLLVNAFGTSSNDGTGYYDIRADFNCDGLVDIGDFGLLVDNFGESGDL